jgi:hypothetical protein
MLEDSIFEKQADKFLDMECPAMVGMLLSQNLRKYQANSLKQP